MLLPPVQRAELARQVNGRTVAQVPRAVARSVVHARLLSLADMAAIASMTDLWPGPVIQSACIIMHIPLHHHHDHHAYGARILRRCNYASSAATSTVRRAMNSCRQPVMILSHARCSSCVILSVVVPKALEISARGTF